MKVKILKPATIGGAIHRPNKLGNVAEVDDKHGALLIKRGFAEEAPKNAPVTLGVTVRPNQPPPVVNIETGEPAPGTEADKILQEEKIAAFKARKAEIFADLEKAPKVSLEKVIADANALLKANPENVDAQAAIEAATERLAAK